MHSASLIFTRMLLVSFAVSCLASNAVAQGTYPSRPVKLVTPFSPAGSSGITARIVSEHLAKVWQVPVIIDTKVGANGNIATVYAVQQPADGYTLLFNASSFVLSPALYVNPGYDPIRDFASIGSISQSPLVYVITGTLPQRTIKDVVDYYRKQPGKLAYASAGVGNGTHLSAQLFFDAMNIQALHVPYTVAANRMPDLIEGRVQFYAGSLSSTIAYLKDGRLRAVAVTSRKRLPQLPDVPTVAESMIPGFEDGLWQGIVGRATMPQATIRWLNAEINKMLAAPDVVAKLETQGAEPFVSTPEQFSVYMKDEMARWAKVVKSAGIKPE